MSPEPSTLAAHLVDRAGAGRLGTRLHQKALENSPKTTGKPAYRAGDKHRMGCRKGGAWGLLLTPRRQAGEGLTSSEISQIPGQGQAGRLAHAFVAAQWGPTAHLPASRAHTETQNAPPRYASVAEGFLRVEGS